MPPNFATSPHSKSSSHAHAESAVSLKSNLATSISTADVGASEDAGDVQQLITSMPTHGDSYCSDDTDSDVPCAASQANEKRPRKRHHSYQQGEVDSSSFATALDELRTPLYETRDSQCIFSWYDKETTATGWLVIDSEELTLSGGGLFMHSQASLGEVRDVARAMSAKLTVTCQPQVVGAKGGIRYPHEASDASGVLQRFVRDHAGVIARYWSTGGDLNTKHEDIDRLVRQFGPKGTQGALDTLTRGFQCRLPAQNVSRTLHEPIQQVTIRNEINGAIPLNEYAAGHGTAIAFKKLLTHSEPSLIGRARMVLQGFGSVGSTFAVAACLEHRLGKIVAICGQDGSLIDEEGIDIVSLLNIRHAGARAHANDDASAERWDSRSLEACLSIDDFIRKRYVPRDVEISDEEHLLRTLSLVQADVFVPCAGRYILTPKVITTLKERTFVNTSPRARCIIAGANNILSSGVPTETSLQALDDGHIKLIPEWISNAGTAALFMRACGGLLRPGQTTESLEDCADDIERFLDDVLRVSRQQQHTEQARTSGTPSDGYGLTSKALWKAAEQISTARRTRGPNNLLGIQRLVEIQMTTADAEQARGTLLNLGCRSSNLPDFDNRLTIAEKDDPSILINQAAPDAPPFELGLQMTFTVENVSRAKKALEQFEISFAEELRPFGPLGILEPALHICTPDFGYTINLIPPSKDDNSLSTAPLRHPSSTSPLALIKDLQTLDHYTVICPDASRVKFLHERLLGFTHLRTIFLNAGSAPPQSNDMLNHVMALPNDTHRSLVITEGLTTQSIFSKLLQRKTKPHIHHMALQVGDVERAFRILKGAGVEMTAERITQDMLSGLRQFFIKEEQLGGGCFVELIERAPAGDASAGAGAGAGVGGGRAGAGQNDGDVDMVSGQDGGGGGGMNQKAPGSTSRFKTQQGDFKTGNMASLAQSMAEYVQD